MLTRKFLSQPKPLLRQSKVKWLVLFLACMMNFGMAYCLDNPQALQDTIQEEFGIENEDFNLLYTFFAIPNLVTPFIGGIIIDWIGVRKAGIIFSMLTIIGQGIISYSAIATSFKVMLFGRIVFGTGGDTLLVVQACVLSKWFLEGQISLAMALGMGISMLGSSVNSIFSPIILDMAGGKLWIPLATGCALCIFSFMCLVVISILDKKADKQEEAQLIPMEKSEKFSFSHLKKFGLLFYLIMMLIALLDGAFYSFMANTNHLLVSRFGFDQVGAGRFVAVVYGCAALLCPLVGYLTDKYGKRMYSMMAACIIFTLSHIYICYLKDATLGVPNRLILVALLSMGLYDSIFSSVIWPSVAIIVEEDIVGSAYGTVTSVANLLAAGLPILLGYIHDKTITIEEGYFWTEVIMALVGYICIMLTVWIWIQDAKKGGTLQSRTEAEAEQVLPSPTLIPKTALFPLSRRHRLIRLGKRPGLRVPLSADAVNARMAAENEPHDFTIDSASFMKHE